MRHVYPNHEIPHLWAHQTQDEARHSTGSFYFEGPTIYSYGSHFPIARHVTNERGDRAVLFTTAHHSVTTSGHCSAVARAIPPNVPVFRVPHLRNSRGDLLNHTDNVESYVRRISELPGKAKRARVNRDWHQREALGLREQLGRYVAFFNLSNVAVPESDELDALQSWIAAHQEEERHPKAMDGFHEQLEPFVLARVLYDPWNCRERQSRMQRDAQEHREAANRIQVRSTWDCQ